MELSEKVILPEKEWYTVKEVAKSWNCSEDDVFHYLFTKKIFPSFYFNQIELDIVPLNPYTNIIPDSSRSTCCNVPR